MISVAREISDIKSEFEGGASFSVDWYTILRQAAEVVRENLNPETLKRVTPIYGGLTNHLQVYYCPSDVRVPSRLYSNDRRYCFDYAPSAQYWAHPEQQNKFTIEYVNGVRFIVVRKAISGSVITLDSMDESDGFGGDVTLAENTYNVLPGATTSLQGTFSDTLYTITKTLDESLDISAVLNGVAIVPFYVDTALDVSSVELHLETDAGDYFKLVSTQDSVGDYFKDGQNMARFWLANRQSTGNPDATNIVSYTLKIQMKSGKSHVVILGKLTLQLSNLFFLEYYSNQMFVDGVTGAWKDTPVKGDSINLDNSVANVFHFEACRITIRKTKTERVDGAESTRMDTELSRAYTNYYRDFPSSAMPMTYNISPDIPHAPDPYWGEGFGDIPESIGDNFPNSEGIPTVFFADDEVPAGNFNGTNATFTLAHVPSPAASLEINLNGQLLVQGVDYTLVSNIITLLTPYYTAPFIGLPFLASYRYIA